MTFFASLLDSNRPVLIITVLIFVLAGLAYKYWYSAAIKSVSEGLEKLTKSLPEETTDNQIESAEIDSVLRRFPYLKSSWDETNKRIIRLYDEKGKSQAAMFGAPRDIWNPSELLSRRINFSLAESVPNILVGIGLLFTFIFLTYALVNATAVFSQAGATTEDTENAISALLQAAGGKFLTSLAGLLSSILWTVASKIALRNLSDSCEAFLVKIGQLANPNGGELLKLQEISLARKRLELEADSNGFAEEILREAREQTGTFKRFETDLAITLAGAISKSFTPKMEEMTERLVSSIDGLSNKMGTMNQEALKTMLEDFSGMLKQTTESEMNQLKDTLSDLAINLKGAGENIGSGAEGAANAINEAGAGLVGRVQDISESLGKSASNLDAAATSIKLAMNDLDTTIASAVQIGRSGADFVNNALDKTGTTLERLGVLSEGLDSAASSIVDANGKISHVVDSIEELSREQRSVVSAVRDSAPNAMVAIQRVSEVLNQSANQTLGVMENTKKSMEATAAALEKTVASITGGITSYTDQVAKLHREMDNNLAKAVGSLAAATNELQETAEEIAENMSRGRV